MDFLGTSNTTGKLETTWSRASRKSRTSSSKSWWNWTIELAESEEGVGSRKTDERGGMLGKGIKIVELVWAFKEQGKTLSWNTKSLDIKKECDWRSNNLYPLMLKG